MRLGIAGSGMIVNEVLPILRRCGWEPAAICATARSREKAEQLCQEYHMEEVFLDFKSMLEHVQMDAVYIGVPNFLHYEFAMQALKAGHNVILEKPFTSNYREAEELAALAKKENLFLFEAITTVYQPNFFTVQKLLPRIGEVKVAVCNYSQYSRRYDAFQRGEVLPVFDPQKSGGALMDLNLYNLHYLLGLFGAPEKISYHANVERGIDTSGILTLDYSGFQAVAIGAKDCAAPHTCMIQGTKGYIWQNMAARSGEPVTLHLNDGTEEHYSENPPCRLEAEFRHFAGQIASGSRTECYRMLQHSLLVSKYQTEARLGAGIYFPADRT